MELLYTVFAFIMIISVIVFIHEYGHYIVARWCGVRIETFSIGFGRELFGYNDKHGTRWKFSLVPMGGYVKMFGDATEASTADAKKLEEMSEEEKAVSFHFKALWQKALIVFAGPFANFLLTICIFTGLIFANGLSTTEPIAGDIIPGSAAEAAGLQPGDRVISVDGEEVARFNDIPRVIATNTGTEITLIIERSGERLTVALTPKMESQEDALGNQIKRPMIGLQSLKLKMSDVGFFPAIGEAIKRTYEIILMSFDFLGQIITGDRGTDELKGPVGIAQLSGQAADKGFITIIWFMALLSANLGMINLFPIPPLDGGHLLFYSIEGLRGRPMAEKYQEWGFRVGFALLMMLMAFTVYNDLKNIMIS